MAPRSDSGREGGDPRPVVAPGLDTPRGTPLYVHVPFCLRKCTYCDFFSVATDRRLNTAPWVDALLREADHRAPEAPETVFLGGGTPTFLPEEQLERLLDGLRARTGFDRSAREVTVECNPESLTPTKAELLRDLGVTRLSIGVQSLDPHILSLFDRPHGPEEGPRAVQIAREAGFEDVSVDLIYGVPGQELGRWLAELDSVLDLGPTHVSAYSLAFEEGTALTRQLQLGRLQEPEEELGRAFFEQTRGCLSRRGYEPYEVSNFQTQGHYCAHNENYWRNGPYVGLGPGAVSHLGRTRFGSPRSIPLWQAAVQGGRFPATWEESLSPLERLGETWWLGLRTAEGVEPARARSVAGLDEASDPAVEEAERLLAQGLLERSGQAFVLSARGLPVADAISRRFLQWTPTRSAG